MRESLIDYRSVARLLLKLMGVAFVVVGVGQLASAAPMLIAADMDGIMRGGWLGFVAQYFLMILFGILLWLFTAPISNTLFKAEVTSGADFHPWLTRLETIGIGLLGLFLGFYAISDLVYHLVTLVQLGPPSDFELGYAEFPAYFIATLIEVGLALWLIFGARGIARMLHSLRYGGREDVKGS